MVGLIAFGKTASALVASVKVDDLMWGCFGLPSVERY